MNNMNMKSRIQEMVDRFHKRMAEDPEAKEEVMSLKKTVNIDLGTESYSMRLEDAEIKEFKEGLLDGADILLKSTPENMAALIDGSLRPTKAYITKKIIIKGNIQDVLKLKHLF
ncbi:MAG: SCP2 sterol-binding domain-containing protein [Candidatus Methanomethylophilaceae archaeon]|nr:SCP2 sterol-binding domain-containing protein [Candidatus Methanomethylophilaceae archaeon]